MAAAASSLYLFSPLFAQKPKNPHFHSYKHHPSYYFRNAYNSNSKFRSFPPPISTLALSLPLSKRNLLRPLKKPTNLRASVASDAAVEQVVSTASGDDSISNVISILLFIAFIGLSILTIGVIYIGVTDFLQKREKEKFEKEEEVNKKKKGGKKVRVRARDGPRGFGQKVDEDEN